MLCICYNTILEEEEKEEVFHLNKLEMVKQEKAQF
jgi:hypothetical protein